jgi:tRNA modification GTPase
LPGARRVRLARLRDDAGVFDEGLVTWMPGPASYTGEDVAEISCHGNPLLVERLLAALVTAGARPAHPGEFTRRAFLNGRMDLTRAEAVLQAITATSDRGLAVARAGLEGRLAAEADALRDVLVDVAAELEAVLDYPEEDLVLGGDDGRVSRLQETAGRARTLASGYRAGRIAVEGARVALVGPVNAGKSSLFNRLLGRDRALVSPTPGTTRDVVEAVVQTPRARLVLMDTAGEREDPEAIEAEGLALAARLVEPADLRLVVLPGDRPLDADGARVLARTRTPRLVVATHADRPIALDLPVDHRVSSVTGDGIAALLAALPSAIAGDEAAADTIVADQRQYDALLRLAVAAEAAATALPFAGPAVAVEEVYAALAALDGLVGRDTREDVLDRLFTRFCIGK